MMNIYNDKHKKLFSRIMSLQFILIMILLSLFITAKGNFNKVEAAETIDNTSKESVSWNGTGTSDDPYLISSADELGLLATNVNSGTGYSGKYFKVTCDINLNTYNAGIWTPIGKYPEIWGTNTYAFCGNFDGGGYTISNVTINSTTTNHEFLGLFGYTYGATIKNVYLDNIKITNTHNRGTNNIAIGGIVGQAAYGTCLYNCGIKSGTINDLSNDSNSGLKAIGGIVGDVLTRNNTIYSYVSNCYAYVDITSNAIVGSKTQIFVGGIVGRLRNQNTGVSTTENYVLNCFFSGNLKGNQYIAPIIAGVYQNTNTADAVSQNGVTDTTMSYYNSTSTFYKSDGTTDVNRDWNKRSDSNYDPLGEPKNIETDISNTIAILNNNISNIDAAYIPNLDPSKWINKDGMIAQSNEKATIEVSITKNQDDILSAEVIGASEGDTINYQWKLNDIDISGATNSTYNIQYDTIDDFITDRIYSVSVVVTHEGMEIGNANSQPYTVNCVVSLNLNIDANSGIATATSFFDNDFFDNIPIPTYSWNNAVETSEDGSIATITGDIGCTVSVEMKFTYKSKEFTTTKSDVYSKVIFVDQENGDDSYDGSSPTYTSATTGPVKSISQAYALLPLNATVDGNIIVICGGDTNYNAGLTLDNFRGIYNCVFPELAMQDRKTLPSTNQTDWGNDWSAGKSATFTTQYNGITYGTGIYINRGNPNTDQHIVLTGDTKFENINFYVSNYDMDLQWYANGFDLTFGENVAFPNIGNVAHGQNIAIPSDSGSHKNVHIFGASLSADKILGGKDNTITISSGSFARVVGGGRNGDTFKNGAYYDDNNHSVGVYNYANVPPEQYMYNSNIVISGAAEVALVCGGQSDGIYYGNSNITVKDRAKVYEITGANIGYNRLKDSNRSGASNDFDSTIYDNSSALNNSPYFNDFKGSTNISIQGGTVNELYGAGLGRFMWQCRVLGDININISGGTVDEVYGGGACGQVGDLEREGSKGSVNPDIDYISDISINITSGQIGNVYGGSYGYYEYLDSSTAKDNGSPIYGNTYVNISGNSNITGNVYGGGRGTDEYSSNSSISTLAQIYGTTNVNIYGGSINGNVFGGAQGVESHPKMAKILNYTDLSGSIVNGHTQIDVYNADIDGSVYAGSQIADIGESDSEVNTSIYVAGGTIKGNIFGGSDQAIVNGSTYVYIGEKNNIANPITIGTIDEFGTISGGTVFGGGNKSISGSDYDSSVPYVTNGSEIIVDGNKYDGTNQPSMIIRDSFFGSGNKCVVYGGQNMLLKDIGKSDDIKKCKSIQRVTSLTIQNCCLELTGKEDSANLYPTSQYSLNRINALKLSDSSHIYLRKGCNIVQDYTSTDVDGNIVTADELGSYPGAGTQDNRLYMYPGEYFSINKNENVSIVDYGNITGMTWFGAFDYDAQGNIVEKTSLTQEEQGIYAIGNYDLQRSSDEQYDEKDGFMSTLSDSSYSVGDIIIPQTNLKTYRLWNLGSMGKNIDCTLTASKNEIAGKQSNLELFQADGSRYIFKFSEAEFDVGDGAQSSENFSFVPADEINSNTPENEFALAVFTGSSGWIENSSEIDEITGETTSKPGGQTTMSDSNPIYSTSTSDEFVSIDIRLTCGQNFIHSGDPVVNITFPIVIQKQLPNGEWVNDGSSQITIKINRITLAQSSIGTLDTGKHYDNVYNVYDVSPSSTEPNYIISNDSSITLQYYREYVDTAGDVSSQTSSIASRKIDFYSLDSNKSQSSCTLPEGTSVTMVDKSGTSPQYYYYSLASPANSINLTDFIKMGSTLTHYTNDVSTYISDNELYNYENFLFMFDFSNVDPELNFSIPHFLCQFESLDSSNNEVFTPVLGKSIGFGISDTTSSYSGSISTLSSEYDKNEDILFHASFAANSVSKNTEDNVLGIEITLYKKDSDGEYKQVEFPRGVAFNYGDNYYQPYSNGIACVIPLTSNIATINDAMISLKTSDKNQTLEAGEYRINADFVALNSSENKNVVNTLVTGLTTDFSVHDYIYSIDSSIADNEMLIYSNGMTINGNNNIKFSSIALKTPLSASNPICIMTLEKKQSDGTYVPVTLNTLFLGFEKNQYYEQLSFDEQIEENIPSYLDLSLMLNNTGIAEGAYRITTSIYENNYSAEMLRGSCYANLIVTDPR